MIINGYIQTGDGVKLDYKNVASAEKKPNRKYDTKQIAIIEAAIEKHSKLSGKVLCLVILKEHGIQLSSATLSKIKKGTY